MNTTGNTNGDFAPRINSPLTKIDLSEQTRLSDLKKTSSVTVSKIAKDCLKESADLLDTTNSHVLNVSAAEIGDFSDLSPEEVAALIKEMEGEHNNLTEMNNEIRQSSEKINQEEQSMLAEISDKKNIATNEENVAGDEDTLSQKNLSQSETFGDEEDTQLRRKALNEEIETSSKGIEASSLENQAALLKEVEEDKQRLVAQHGDKNVVFKKKFVKIKDFLNTFGKPDQEGVDNLHKLMHARNTHGHFDFDTTKKIVKVEKGKLGQIIELDINGEMINFKLMKDAKMPYVENGIVKYLKVATMSEKEEEHFKTTFANFVEKSQKLHAFYGITPTKSNEVVEEHKEEYEKVEEEHTHASEHTEQGHSVVQHQTQDVKKGTKHADVSEIGISSVAISQKQFLENVKQLRLKIDKLIKFLMAELIKEENKLDDIKKLTIREEIIKAERIAEQLEEIVEGVIFLLKQEGILGPQIAVIREQYKEFRKMYAVCTQTAKDPSSDKQIINKSYMELVSKALVIAEGVNVMIGQSSLGVPAAIT